MPTRYLLLLIFVGVLLTIFIQLEIISIAFQKLGLSPRSALLLMLWALLGSSVITSYSIHYTKLYDALHCVQVAGQQFTRLTVLRSPHQVVFTVPDRMAASFVILHPRSITYPTYPSPKGEGFTVITSYSIHYTKLYEDSLLV